MSQTEQHEVDRMTNELSRASGLRSRLLVDMLERYRLNGLRELSYEQVKRYYNEWRRGR